MVHGGGGQKGGGAKEGVMYSESNKFYKFQAIKSLKIRIHS